LGKPADTYPTGNEYPLLCVPAESLEIMSHSLRIRLALFPLVLIALLMAQLAVTGSALAVYNPGVASICGSDVTGITVTPLNAMKFLIESDEGDGSYVSSYVGYKVENSDGVHPISKPWVTLTNFGGGVMSLAPNEPGKLPLADTNLGGGDADHAFFYLTASGATAVDQTHRVYVYAGKPGDGGDPICYTPETYTDVVETQFAMANQVNSESGLPASVALGQTFSFTVNGDTGTIAAQENSLFRTSPATSNTFPAGAFRLTNSSYHISPDDTATFFDYAYRLSMDAADWTDVLGALT
jgi:hypothetical protein